MYVMRLTSNFTKDDDGSVTASTAPESESDLSKPAVLITYRNIPSLPAVIVDDFPSVKEALDYIQRIEPTCPRVSLGGRPPEPIPTWQDHLAWLHGQGLRSSAEGDTPTPKWAEPLGANPRETFVMPPKK
jgi:hypothetical protein